MKNNITLGSIKPWKLAALTALALGFAAAGIAQPESAVGFSKSFAPDTIGPGSTSKLTFTIINYGQSPVSDLAFTDNLPTGPSDPDAGINTTLATGLVIATPSSAMTTCVDAVLSAPDGGTTISLTDGKLGTGETCTVTVHVTGSAPGTYDNVSGDLTSTDGNSGPATATLTIDAGRPGFTKSFDPSSIPPGGTGTLTLTIDNTANESAVSGLFFSDLLPAGMAIATPSNASTDCSGGFFPPVVTAISGTNSVSLSQGYVAALSSCTVTVDVTAATPGTYVNTTLELSGGSPSKSSGFATAVLDVPIDFLIKSFTDDPVPPGGTVTLQFSINNLNRGSAATNISFADDLDATLSGLAPNGALPSDPCGAGSSLTFTAGTLTLTGGGLPAEGNCTFSVPLLVPAGASSGSFPNTTGTITSDIWTGNTATDNLVVSHAPILTKEFTDDPVGAGNPVNLRFTITNVSPTSAATDIAFTDELTTFLPFPVVATLPAAGFCGPGASMFLVSPTTGSHSLLMTGGSLAAAGMPGDSCTFDVTLEIPKGFPGGSYVNTTQDLTATVGGTTEAGLLASDDLVVVAAPSLTKEFTDNPVLPGDTVTLELTLTHDEQALGDATEITFINDLDATLSGLVAVGLPMPNICGAGSTISGTSNLTFTGGSLAPGETCTFSVTLQVPAALPGTYTNTTSDVVATVLGNEATENPASDNLKIAGLSLTKEFTEDPVLPGATTTLRFTLENVSPTANATGMLFTDSLSATLTGLTATGLPMNDVCGGGSQISGTSSLIFTGGSLTAGTSCTFDVTLQVPAGAADGNYGNTTSNLTANIDGSPVILDPGTDQLTVSSTALELTKEFTDDPVLPGSTVNLEFSITNLDASQTAINIAFTDDLNAVLAGLAATGLPINDVCGAGAQIAGTTTLSLTGGSLGPGASCTFNITLQVPADAGPGIVTNTTSDVTGNLGGLAVGGGAASDTLEITTPSFPPGFSKSFSPNLIDNGVPSTLTFTIDNTPSGVSVTNLDFTDNLPAGMMVVTPNPNVSKSCLGGSVTAMPGASVIAYTGGGVPAGSGCTVQVDVTGITGGVHVNTTGSLTSSAGNSGTATDTLTVCGYTLSPTSAEVGVNGGSYSFDVTATDSVCDWMATTTTPWITLDSDSGLGNGTVNYTVAVNPDPNQRIGTIMVHDQTFTVTQAGKLDLVLDKTSLVFNGTTDRALFTGSQMVQISIAGSGTVNWTVSSDAAWVLVSPMGGTDQGNLTVSLDPSTYPLTSWNSTITVTSPDASNSPQTVAVSGTAYATGSSRPPFGFFDTPADGAMGLSGNIAVTGWLLDDIEATGVKLYRSPVASEPSGLVFIGDANFVEGTRPDVAALNQSFPFSYRAGWGYMLLTNALPNQGNGTFEIHAVGRDKEGHTVQLGSKTITVDNANAVKPFGTIDTPTQGGMASGSSFMVWGWALTPQPNTIPKDGSTILVWVDGQMVGNVTYNIYRNDVATYFPGLNNSSGPVGYFYLDTTQYDNGVHTIAWSVEDDAGNIDGIGSRYFTISNTN